MDTFRIHVRHMQCQIKVKLSQTVHIRPIQRLRRLQILLTQDSRLKTQDRGLKSRDICGSPAARSDSFFADALRNQRSNRSNGVSLAQVKVPRPCNILLYIHIYVYSNYTWYYSILLLDSFDFSLIQLKVYAHLSMLKLLER